MRFSSAEGNFTRHLSHQLLNFAWKLFSYKSHRDQWVLRQSIARPSYTKWTRLMIAYHQLASVRLLPYFHSPNNFVLLQDIIFTCTMHCLVLLNIVLSTYLHIPFKCYLCISTGIHMLCCHRLQPSLLNLLGGFGSLLWNNMGICHVFTVVSARDISGFYLIWSSLRLQMP